MVEKNQEWILPENLEKAGKLQREAVDQGGFEGGGDYGSYYAYRKGLNYDHIKTHALVDEQMLKEYAGSISAYLKKCDLSLKGNIMDVGCAIGSITDALNELNPDKTTSGIELSEDGVAIAREKYPNCRFYQQSADDLSNFEDEVFDVIHAREFYPFTRTDDREYHLKFLQIFYPKLKKDGFVILQMVGLDKGLFNTYEDIKSDLKACGYSVIQQEVMITTKLFRIFGPVIYSRYGYWFFRLFNVVLKIFKRTPTAYFYLFVKENKNER